MIDCRWDSMRSLRSLFSRFVLRSFDPRRGLTQLASQADNAVLADPASHKAGSVGTIALLHSLDMPHSLPYYHSSLLSLTLSHIGDTRALLSSTSSGRVTTLTENHHPDSRVESIRLRQSGTGIVTDSFGESRWGGGLANTRGVGDREFKSLGVIAEPEVSTRVLKSKLCSDSTCLSPY